VAVDERVDLKLSAADKQLLAQAAAIEGLSMALATLRGLDPGEEVVESLIRTVLDVFEQAAAKPLHIPVIAGGIATGGAFPDPAARAVLVDAQPAAAMALPQAGRGAMGRRMALARSIAVLRRGMGSRTPC
jgi:hypothetical protein